MRHTFLTEAGEFTDPFTLRYVAGHDNIKTTMRYVHPRKEAVQKLFVRLGRLKRPEPTTVEKSVRDPGAARSGQRVGAESGVVVGALGSHRT